MKDVLYFINDHILPISIFIYVWFAIDCIRYKRLLTDKFEWFLYILHVIGMIYGLKGLTESGQFLFKGLV